MSLRTVLILYSTIFILFSEGAPHGQIPAVSSFKQRLVIWAWEKPEELHYIDPQQTAVAFLAKTIILSTKGMSIQPRLQPLTIPTGTELIPVVRLECRRLPANWRRIDLASRIVRILADVVKENRARKLQIDFDARLSERDFYREIIRKLRREIPENSLLSITALTSWCLHDTWIRDLPVDEAVPMLFRMGADTQEIWSFLHAGSGFTLPVCSQSLGISLDELPERIPAGKRIWIFNPQPWNKNDYQRIIEEIAKWQRQNP